MTVKMIHRLPLYNSCEHDSSRTSGRYSKVGFYNPLRHVHNICRIIDCVQIIIALVIWIMIGHSNEAVLRNFKPERSIREEPFVPGIDPGVRDWLVVRQAGRDAQMKGSMQTIVTCDLKYKLNQFWREQLWNFENCKTSEIPSTVPAEILSTTTLTQFQTMLLNRCSYEDILTLAMKKRNVAFIELSLKHGIDINYRMGHCRRTMLQTACRDGDITKCKFLLNAGADINKRDVFGCTALHLAIQTPSTFHPLEIVTILLERGCKVNAQDKHGHTALHLACIISSKDIIEVLLKYHALPFLLNRKKKLAIDYTKSVRFQCVHNLDEIFFE